MIELVVHDSDINIRDEFFGEDYGIPTPEGKEAVRLLNEQESIYLENTYTGKAVAALLHDLRSGKLTAKDGTLARRCDGQMVLYWNTLNSRDFSNEIADVDFHDLPSEFHSYFS